MMDFCLNDIVLRYDVSRKFVEHTDKVLKMFIQSGTKDPSGHIYSDGRLAIATKTPMYDLLPIMAGGWVDFGTGYYGTDIVSLYAYQRNISYHHALNEILDAFDKKENFGLRKSETKWHIQEKNPISIDFPKHYVDYFCAYFYSQVSIHQYHNKHGRIIGATIKFDLKDGNKAEIFHTIWRQYKSEILKIVPLFPEKPYMIYNEHLINANIKSVKFEENEIFADQNQQCFSQYDLMYSACPGGLKNLPDADFAGLHNKDILIDFTLDNKDFNFTYFDILEKKCEEYNVRLFFISKNSFLLSHPNLRYEYEFDCDPEKIIMFSGKDVLSKPEHYGLQPPAIELEHKKLGNYILNLQYGNLIINSINYKIINNISMIPQCFH